MFLSSSVTSIDIVDFFICTFFLIGSAGILLRLSDYQIFVIMKRKSTPINLLSLHLLSYMSMNIDKMEYNTTRNHLAMREYGRHIQKMIEYLLTLEDQETRQR